MKTEEYKLPMYWASYLINGDASGLFDKEQEEIERFLSRKGLGACLDCSEEPEFLWSQGADCLTFTFIVREA
jgi:hypothetical protein